MNKRERLFWAMKDNLKNPHGYQRERDEFDFYETFRKVRFIAIIVVLVGGVLAAYALT